MKILEKNAFVRANNLILCPFCGKEISLEEEELCEECLEEFVADQCVEEFIWHPNKEY